MPESAMAGLAATEMSFMGSVSGALWGARRGGASASYGKPARFVKRGTMRRWPAVAVIPAIPAAILTAILAAAPALPAAAEQPIKIVALGDSLVAGYGLPASEAFPAQLEKALKAKGHAVAIANAGVSGDTASGGLARLDW